jgi:conjugal transfer pilus assembly protein TraI
MGLFGHRRPSANPAPLGRDVAPADDPEIPRYPPFLKGLPVAAPSRIVATQGELIARLQDALAFTDTRFAALVRPVVERYAAFVHLLPASEAHHHRGAGGLFRHGLEVAFHAAQASQGRIFALDRGPAERRELEPRWRLAAGLAGLCHDVGKPVSDLSVSDREGRTTWRPLLGSLTDWATANGVEHYFLRWRERRHARHETFGLLVLERILTPEVTAWLVDADPEILQGLLAAVAGIDDAAALGTLVAEADRASVERDLRENHIDLTATSLGVPVDRYLLDAMRRLARGGRWQVNVRGARLWMLAEGLHVVWPAGAEDIVGVLAADKVPGIPRDPDTLADILLERGLAIPRQEGAHSHRYWRLAPSPLAKDGQVVTLSMLRLASPDLVLAGVPPASVGVVLPSEQSMRGGAGPSMELAASETRAEPGESVGEGTLPGMPVSAEAEPALTRGSDPQEAPCANPRTTADAQSAPRSVGHLADAPPGEATDLEVQPQETANRATTWLRSRGAGGETVLALAEVLAADPNTWDQRIRRKGDRLLVLFPDGLAGLGAAPQAALDALAQSGLLDLNPLAPLRRVIEIEGRHGAPLTLEASRRLLALVPGDGSGPRKPLAVAPAPGHKTVTRARQDRVPPGPTNAPSDPQHTSPADPDPARTLVERIKARDQTLPGGVSEADGWLHVTPETIRTWAQVNGLQPYALIRTLGHLPGCRVTPDGGLRVRETP